MSAAGHVRRSSAVLGASVVLALAAGVVASGLPVYTDFSYLLPPSARSVQDLRALEGRTRVLGTLMVAIEAADPTLRAEAAARLRDDIAALGPEVAASLTFDQQASRRFVWEHRWLYAPLEELRAAHHALAEARRRAVLAHNPLLVELAEDLEEEQAPPPVAGLARLRERLVEAERQREDPGAMVTADGQLQLMVLRTAFSSGELGGGGALLGRVRERATAVEAAYPGVTVGLAGDIVSSYEEHRSILGGMVASSLATFALVLAALWAYLGSLRQVAALAWSLLVAILLTFAAVRFQVGHLNLATAFLSSIVAGNGINFGIMLLARLQEATRAGEQGAAAIATAIAETWRGTLAAALAAVAAYASLVVTDFRGFRHFGIIASTGMLACWISAYTVLPACLLALARRGPLAARREAPLGPMLARLVPARPVPVALLGLLLAGVAGLVAWRALADDPYEANLRNIRSESPGLAQERRWMHAIDEGFGQGVSGGFVIGTTSHEEAGRLAARLRAVDVGQPPERQLFNRVNVIDDVLPADQQEKLALLKAIAPLLDDRLIAALPADDRAAAVALRPPAGLAALAPEDLPAAMAWPFTEADGQRGRLLLAMSGMGYDVWDTRAIIAFAGRVRALDLPADAQLGGAAFVFADMLALIQRDGPRASLVAALAATVVVVAILGISLEASVTLLSGLVGVLSMVALVLGIGLRVNFLDFVALPITIGIGIDYAANICARHRRHPEAGARGALTSAGGAVLMSSYTTIVGYGSLLLSANRGIRSFGAAAILGEATCLAVALALAPAWLDALARRRAAGAGR